MLYVYEMDGKVYVSSLDPDDTAIDFEKLIAESFEATVPNLHKPMPASIQSGIIRNVLANGQAKVVMR